ncbi:hypothetical protein [Streptomyces marincola]|uniref:hypothetical protein n=1 Tax=Streptomyces marincola TaxID=2878388 RepID=UPI001CF0DD2D|nr:hypothetical protein [Streptomyces marincola]UCM91297.1 hypothetical protein LC193_26995 [Streptomyces marincola]
MTAPTVDEILAGIRIPVSSAPFDAAAGLRRLAAETGRRTASAELARVRQARQTLNAVSGWVIDRPGAAEHLSRLVDDPPPDSADEQENAGAGDDDILKGAMVFACLLYLTGHQESAQFWWQLAAGAGDRTAAYCLHLHHRDLGEPREATHWYREARTAGPDSPPLIDDVIDVMESMARYSRKHRLLRVPTESLEPEVDRLAGLDTHGLVNRRPDRRLADRLHQVAGQH